MVATASGSRSARDGCGGCDGPVRRGRGYHKGSPPCRAQRQTPRQWQQKKAATYAVAQAGAVAATPAAAVTGTDAEAPITTNAADRDGHRATRRGAASDRVWSGGREKNGVGSNSGGGHGRDRNGRQRLLLTQ